MEQDFASDAPQAGWITAADGTPILRYEVEPWGPALHVEWQPGPPLDDVKFGFTALGLLLRQHGSVALISDSNSFTGDWSELIPWVRYEFLPSAIAGGLCYLADVLPLDPANSFSMYRWREQTRGLLHHGVFSSLAGAREWVQQRLETGGGQ